MVVQASPPVFRAIADPTRRRILELLGAGGRPVSEIAALFPVSRPAISKHLRILREAGLVFERREGRQRIYEGQIGRLELVANWVAGVGAEPDPSAFAAAESPLRAERPPAKARGSTGAGASSTGKRGAGETASEGDETEWRSW